FRSGSSSITRRRTSYIPAWVTPKPVCYRPFNRFLAEILPISKIVAARPADLFLVANDSGQRKNLLVETRGVRPRVFAFEVMTAEKAHHMIDAGRRDRQRALLEILPAAEAAGDDLV